VVAGAAAAAGAGAVMEVLNSTASIEVAVVLLAAVGSIALLEVGYLVVVMV
jgi:hypothetical protein